MSYVSSLEKKSLKSILSKRIFSIENECKTPNRSLTFIFYQKYFYDKVDLRLYEKELAGL